MDEKRQKSGTFKDPVAGEAGTVGVLGALKVDGSADPVAANEQARAAAGSKKDTESLGIEGLSLTDFQPIPDHAARVRRPFDGYPEEMVTITDAKGKKLAVKKHFVVALSPTVPVFQDPSNNNVVVGSDQVRKLKTYHSRFIRDGHTNTETVFDREIRLENGQALMCAIVPSHVVRAQIMFALVRRGKGESAIQVDKRYLLLDTRQVSRLRETFQIIINPKLRSEKMSQWISGESEAAPGDIGSESASA